VSSVQSVERALLILRALGAGPAGVTDLAERVGLAKSTVSRMLGTLEASGAVEQIEGGGPYRLGPLVMEIAAASAPNRTLAEAAHPVLVELSNATAEAVGLAVREDDVVRFTDQCTPPGEVQVRDWTGSTAPLHWTPSGLILLAFAAQPDVDGYLQRTLEASTPNTMTDPVALRARLQQARFNGWVWVYGEFSLELNSVAAPVFDRAGHVLAAVNLHGPSYRFPGTESVERITRQVVDAAARLTEMLRT
jgi:IclR family transcriptional regulator, acetate operon repressor